jgi:diguanylate cyclase (GGDEF)-like protein/PAS domain S-box-containing protein
MRSSGPKNKPLDNRRGDLAPATLPCRIDGHAAPSFDALRTAFDLLPDPVFCIDREFLAFASVNRAACSALGYEADELLALAVCDVCSQADVAALRVRLDATAEESAIARVLQRSKGGRLFPLDWHVATMHHSGATYWIVVAREPSVAGVAAERADDACAASCGLGIPGHDPLTGLPDRRLFKRRLDRALERSRRHGDYQFAVCFLDIDNFKSANDSHGHLTGDRLLCEVARRLCACVRPGDMVARFGGDEFTLLIDNLHDAGEAMFVAQRILSHMETPATVDGHDVKIVASIGVAASSPDYRQSEDLLRDADLAMYGVKAAGGADCLLFTGPRGAGRIKPR